MDFAFEPSTFERKWLQGCLATFVDDGLIDAILYPVKGGKEAAVYCCRTRSGSDELVAAKVYRPRQERAMRNQAQYQMGRDFLGTPGAPRRKAAVARAIKRRSKFARQLQDSSWIAHEHDSMSALYSVGGSVPRPVARSTSVLLMEFVGDDHAAAPALNEVTLSVTAAHRAFDEIIQNVELLLRQDRVHADLSAHNVLFWHSHAVLIDFPQVVDARHHPAAFELLNRDVRHICKYFSRQINGLDPAAIVTRLTTQYHRGAL